VKIRSDRRQLAEALAWVAQAISKRPYNPAMAGMRLSAEGDHLILAATDHDVSHAARLAVDVVTEGECLVAGGFLREIVGALKGAEVELVLDADRLAITSGRASYRAQVLRLDDYPAMPDFPATVGTLAHDDLTGALGAVEHAAGRDLAVPVLTGVRIEGEPGTLRMLTTDRFRMARAETRWTGAEEFTALAPSRPLSAAVKGMSGTVTLGYAGELLGVADESRAVTMRCLTDDFPDINRFLAAPGVGHVDVDAGDLADAVKRAGMVGGDHRAVLLTIRPGEIEVTAESDTGDGAEQVEAETEESRTVLLSAHMIADALAAAGSDRVRIEFTGADVKPIFVRPLDNQRVDLLVMPRRQM
jgi:DNA polymerase-3 subunit beta